MVLLIIIFSHPLSKSAADRPPCQAELHADSNGVGDLMHTAVVDLVQCGLHEARLGEVMNTTNGTNSEENRLWSRS